MAHLHAALIGQVPSSGDTLLVKTVNLSWLAASRLPSFLRSRNCMTRLPFVERYEHLNIPFLSVVSGSVVWASAAQGRCVVAAAMIFARV